VLWHLGYTTAASAATLTQSYQAFQRAAVTPDPTYCVRGILTDDFDSTTKSLRTRFPSARLGTGMRHALLKLPKKLVAMASPVRKERGVQFADLRVANVMLPRVDIVAVDLTLPEDEVLDRAAQTIHARLPAYAGTLEQVTGILHLQDVFKYVRQAKQGQSLRQLVRPALFVPEVMALDNLPRTFQRHQTQMALVVDEHGSLEGLVTLEDVVEELVGEVHDALEAAQPSLQHLPDGRVLVRGEVRRWIPWRAI
jgi:CBS domain-containing protein